MKSFDQILAAETALRIATLEAELAKLREHGPNALEGFELDPMSDSYRDMVHLLELSKAPIVDTITSIKVRRCYRHPERFSLSFSQGRTCFESDSWFESELYPGVVT